MAATGSDEVSKDDEAEKVEAPPVVKTRGRPAKVKSDNAKENNGSSKASSRRTSAAASELPSDLDNNDHRSSTDSPVIGGKKVVVSDGVEAKENGVNGDDLIEDTATGFKFNVQKAKQLLKTSANNAPNFDTIPDCSGWSCQQVFDYFNQFFPKEAHIFKEQEIDGTSLLLMTRSDMFKFNLKVGPALNMYRHVVMLQTRSYDPRKTWK